MNLASQLLFGPFAGEYLGTQLVAFALGSLCVVVAGPVEGFLETLVALTQTLKFLEQSLTARVAEVDQPRVGELVVDDEGELVVNGFLMLAAGDIL